MHGQRQVLGSSGHLQILKQASANLCGACGRSQPAWISTAAGSSLCVRCMDPIQCRQLHHGLDRHRQAELHRLRLGCALVACTPLSLDTVSSARGLLSGCPACLQVRAAPRRAHQRQRAGGRSRAVRSILGLPFSFKAPCQAALCLSLWSYLSQHALPAGTSCTTACASATARWWTQP